MAAETVTACRICGGPMPPRVRLQGPAPTVCASNACMLEARRETSRISARKHADKNKAWLKAKLAEDPDYARNVHRRWKERNLERERERQRQWTLANKERENARKREYQRRRRLTNPVPVEYKRAADKRSYERLKADSERLAKAKPVRRVNWMARRARFHAAFVERVDARVVFQRSGGVCGICHEAVDPDSKWHVDHIVPLSRGGLHKYDNCQLAHATCNLSKNDRTPEEMAVA